MLLQPHCVHSFMPVYDIEDFSKLEHKLGTIMLFKTNDDNYFYMTFISITFVSECVSKIYFSQFSLLFHPLAIHI